MRNAALYLPGCISGCRTGTDKTFAPKESGWTAGGGEVQAERKEMNNIVVVNFMAQGKWKLGNWEIGKLGNWEIGKLRNWVSDAFEGVRYLQIKK